MDMLSTYVRPQRIYRSQCHNRTQKISAEYAALATVPGMVCGWTGGAGLTREVVTIDGELYHGATKRSLLGHCGEVTVRSL